MKRLVMISCVLLFVMLSGSNFHAFGEDFQSDDPWSGRQRQVIQEQRTKMKLLNKTANERILGLSKSRDEELERIRKDTNAAIEKLQVEANNKLLNIKDQIKKLQEKATILQKEVNIDLKKLQNDAQLKSETVSKESEIDVENVAKWHKEESQRIQDELQQRLKEEDGSNIFAPGVGIAPTGPPSLNQ